jgi:hypothetical protein
MMFADKDAMFIKLLKNLLSKTKNGSVTITKQNGEVMYLTVGETHLSFENFNEYAGNATDGNAAMVVESGDLSAFLTYLDRVKFGAVSIKIQDSRIIGVEKNETYKIK